MDKVIVIRHSDNNEHLEQTRYDEYVKKHGLHFNLKLLDYALKYMENYNRQDHKWTTTHIQDILNKRSITIPSTSNIYDVTYTANMAYADFFPDILNEDKCIDFALAVANDIDGYEGILFLRWVSDQNGKLIDINWELFI